MLCGMPQKILSACLLTKYIKCSVRGVAVRPSYIWVARWLRVFMIIEKVSFGNNAGVACLKARVLFIEVLGKTMKGSRGSSSQFESYRYIILHGEVSLTFLKSRFHFLHQQI